MSNYKNKLTKAQLVYSDLKEKVLSGVYPPNKIMNLNEIAENYNTSLIPIREAMARLSAEGYILHIPYIGMMVLEAPKDYLYKIYDLRIVLEGAATFKAINNLDTKDIETLENFLLEMEEKLKGNDYSGYQDINERFHFLIYSGSKNELLIDQIRILWKRYPRDTLTLIPSRLTTSFEEHKQILQAVKAKDPSWCEALVINHIKHALYDVIKYRKNVS